MKEDEQLRAYLPENVVLLKNDCEKGAGVDLAKKYEVKVYPTFAMVNTEGTVTDRWAGYEGVENFTGKVDLARADTRTIDEKKKAFGEDASLALTKSLAQYSEAVFANEDAVKYYRHAMELDPTNVSDYRKSVFMAMYYGLRSEQFTSDDILTAGNEILASPDTEPTDMLMVANVVKRVAPTEAYVPVMQQALDATAASTDEDIQRYRRELLVDHALYVEHDNKKAVALKKETMDEGWKDDPGALNSFAWWCFENDVDLENAFEMAMRGVELAPDDGTKANILDTAAEIAFKRGDVARAIELEETAITLAPDREGFQKTLQKFQEAGES